MSGKIQISVSEPCHENWSKMTVNEQGRFCQSCQKTVTDFSMMSDKEILNYLSQRNTNLCGRFTDDQLNRPLITEYKKKFSWAYLWNFMIATFLTTGYVNAQSKKTNPKRLPSVSKNISETENIMVKGEIAPLYTVGDTEIIIRPSVNAINGLILDSKTNQPIALASINIKGTIKGMSADESGVFNLPVSPEQKNIILVISAVGYEPKEFTITPTSNKLSLYLDASEEMLEPVVIIAYPAISCRSVSGGISIVTEVEIVEKMERSLSNWTPELLKKKEIKLYPNPVAPGAALTIALSLKEAGDYTAEILDASGKIVYRGQVSIQSKEQNITIPTSATWNKGMYWVRLTGKDSKKILHSKLMLK